MSLGIRLRAARKQKELTLKEVQSETGISFSFLSDIERGRTNPSLDTLRKLSAFYGVAIGEIMSDIDPEHNQPSQDDYYLPHLRAAIDTAKATQADMDALGVGKPAAPPTPMCAGCGLAVDDDLYLIKVWPTIDVREYWHTTCFVREHSALAWPTGIPTSKQSNWQGVRAGLLKGRIRTPHAPVVPDPRPEGSRPAFDEALAQASVDDLTWALNLLITHPNSKRTYRKHRMTAIAARLQELAGQGGTP